MSDTTREITYSPLDKDYTLTLGGQFVGCARSYVEGERILDELVYQRAEYERERQILAYSVAYKAAKAEGRELDAALYRREGLALVAQRPIESEAA
jgi:hypothetical protein